ncbi:MAG: hypothetical protein HY918_03515 [Candidatus Doudnabacteria bacterium]|nr:hypothetical protein [Candidatus Doudnabacteria bacterium]
MRNKQVAVAVLMVAASILPNFAFAALGARVNASAEISAKVPAGANFCTNLNTYAARITENLTKGSGNLENKQGENKQKLQERQVSRAEKLSETRDTGDADRQAIYAKLMANASTTEAHKQAVIQFQATVEAAVTTRRAAVDAAIKAYWDGMNSALSGRQASIEAARTKFITAINAAISTAQSSCASNADAGMVKAQFRTSVEAARTQFATDRKAIDKYGPQVKALVQTRNAAVRKAFDAFHATMEQARITLKAALKA